MDGVRIARDGINHGSRARRALVAYAA